MWSTIVTFHKSTKNVCRLTNIYKFKQKALIEHSLEAFFYKMYIYFTFGMLFIVPRSTLESRW